MKLIFSFTVLFFLSSSVLSQEGNYYYGANNKILEGEQNARIIKTVKKGIGNRYRIITKMKSNNDWVFIKSERIINRNREKQVVRYNESTFLPRTYKRTITSMGDNAYHIRDYKREVTLRTAVVSNLIPLNFEGKVSTYYRTGEKESESEYSQNMLQSNSNWYKDGSEYIHNIYYSADKAPTYSNGNSAFRNYIINKIAEAKLPVHQIQDEVIIGAVVMESGELKGVRVVKGKVPSVNLFLTEAIEALPGEWEPAVLNGEKVRYFVQIPINFVNTVSSIQNIEFTKDGSQILWND